MQLAVVILSINEADFLRVTLPRTRRALPDAKVFVVSPVDDGESQAVATALRAQTLAVPRDVLTANDAKFNYAALVRHGQEHVQNVIKMPTWIVFTRAQVVLDACLTAIDLTTLDQSAVYGCGFQEVQSAASLLSYAAEEPSAEEVRSLVPDCQFLMSFSQGPKFDVWSATTHEGVTRFLNNFESKYMIQKKFAHLGPLNLDVDGRVSARYGDPRSKVRIEPVHAGATEKINAEAEKKTEESKPLEASKSLEASKTDAEAPPASQEGSKPASEIKSVVNDNIKTETVSEKEVSIPKSWKVNRFAGRGFLPADDDGEPVPQSNAAQQGKGTEEDVSTFSKARSEPEDQQNVPLASVSRAQTLNQEDDDIKTKSAENFGRAPRFGANPWKAAAPLT
jgi:hypothetical protein